jgi:ribose transport system ATP-binding protein
MEKSMASEIMRLENVSKTSQAHNVFNINLDLYSGEILGVLERSGQSFDTIIKLITGAIAPDSGHIYFEENEITDAVPNWARRFGIYCIQFEPCLIYGQSVAENICVIGDIKKAPYFINQEKNNIITREILDEFGLSHVYPDDSVSRLPISICYILEILRCKALGIKVLLIGDILSNFPHNEYELLIKAIKRYSSLGTCTVLFSDTYNDLLEAADRIDIIRSNTVVSHIRKPLPDKDTINAALTGLLFRDGAPPAYFEGTDIVLKLKLQKNMPSAKDSSLYVRKGEIVGILGVSNDNWINDITDFLMINKSYGWNFVLNDSAIELNPSTCAGLPYIQIIPSLNMNDYMYYNMSLMDNVTVNLPDTAYYPGGVYNKSVKKYFYKNALSSIHCEYLIPMFEKYPMIPHLSKEIQLQIMFARAVCARASVIILLQPYDNYGSADLMQLLHSVCVMGISVIIVSAKYSSLSDACSRIYVLDGNTVVSEINNSLPKTHNGLNPELLL